MRTYGLPYKGSKSLIAERLLGFLPKADTFVDLFAGGCAMTHCAMLSGKYRRIIYNDLEHDILDLFDGALSGKYANDTRWISREDFFRLKDTDPYVRYCWSFGNDGATYMFSKENEVWKKAIHYAVFFRDYTQPNPYAEYGVDLSKIDGVEGVNARKLAVRKLVVDALKAYSVKSNGHLRMDGDSIENACSSQAINNFEKVSDFFRGTPCRGGGQTVEYGDFSKSPRRAESSQSDKLCGGGIPAAGLQTANDGTRGKAWRVALGKSGGVFLVRSGKDYRDVEIPADSTVYCDPPYAGKEGYGRLSKEQNKGLFDHAAFLDWCATRDFPVFVSEYCIEDDRFECVLELDKLQTLAKTRRITERLYVQRKFAGRYRRAAQLSFDLGLE